MGRSVRVPGSRGPVHKLGKHTDLEIVLPHFQHLLIGKKVETTLSFFSFSFLVLASF